MSTKRQIEIFSAGCPLCQDTINIVNKMACASCEISVLDTNDMKVAARAKKLGIGSVPAVVVDGKLAECCADRHVDANALRQSGIGTPLP